MAINAIYLSPKVAGELECILCEYKCSKRCDMKKHVLTAKHKIKEKCYILGDFDDVFGDFDDTSDKMSPKKCRCECGKKYSHYNSLWRHKKTCTYVETKNGESQSLVNFIANTPEEKEMTDKDLIKELMKQNSEFKDLIIDQTQKMMEISMKSNAVTHANSHNNSNSHNTNTINSNNKFNLQFFLNETCKDAMNLTDFIDSIKVKLDDLEYTGENGYAAGVTNIILRELKELDICKRPIHCSDIKREIFHIKNDNEWAKERELLIKTIKQTTRKSIFLLEAWREKYPGCIQYDHPKNDQYMKINGEVLGPYEDHVELKDFNRIIANVAKATGIDKKLN